MSSDASAPAAMDGEPISVDRERMLDLLDIGIHEAARKIDNGRIRDADKEKARQGWVRCLAYAVNIRRQVANDAELSELSDRVERLEEAQR